jgi:hypothetical protein
MAGLVAASGLAAEIPLARYLVWLPITDGALGVLGQMKPEWLVKPGYQALPRNTCQAHLWSGMWQGVIVIRRWLTVGTTGVLLSRLVVGEGDGSRVELESVPGARRPNALSGASERRVGD